MRSAMFSASKPVRTSSVYLAAALTSVDHRFRVEGCVGSCRDSEGMPLRVESEKSRYRMA